MGAERPDSGGIMESGDSERLIMVAVLVVGVQGMRGAVDECGGAG